MKFPYSRSRNPHELIVRVRVSSLAKGNAIESTGKLDTGADLTVIPEKLRKELRIFPGPAIRVKGPFNAGFKEQRAYYINIALGDNLEFELKVLAWERDYCLLGRDLLNQLILHADGPAESFEISIPGDLSK